MLSANRVRLLLIPCLLAVFYKIFITAFHTGASEGAAEFPLIALADGKASELRCTQQQKITFNIPIKNTSSKSCEITDVDKSCGCLAAECKDTIVVPGGQTELIISVNTGTQRNSVSQVVTLVYREIDEVGNIASPQEKTIYRTLTIPVRYTVQPEYDIAINRSPRVAGLPMNINICITSRSLSELKVAKVVSSSPSLKFTSLSNTAAGQYEATMLLEPSELDTDFGCEIFVYTNSLLEPVHTIRFRHSP